MRNRAQDVRAAPIPERNTTPSERICRVWRRHTIPGEDAGRATRASARSGTAPALEDGEEPQGKPEAQLYPSSVCELEQISFGISSLLSDESNARAESNPNWAVACKPFELQSIDRNGAHVQI